jgi:hypothetical protein
LGSALTQDVAEHGPDAVAKAASWAFGKLLAYSTREYKSPQRIVFNSFHTSKDSIEALFDRLLPVGNSIMQINVDGSCRQKLLSLTNTALYGPVWRPGADREAGPVEC